MSTPYSKVFSSFLRKITDYTYASYNIEELEDQELIPLLNSAIVEFEYPKVNIRDKDDELKVFNVDLDIDETEILGYLMVDRWVDRQVYNIELFKQRFKTRDFDLTSQANHLETLSKSQERIQAKVRSLKKKYSYRMMGNQYNIANFTGLSSGD